MPRLLPLASIVANKSTLHRLSECVAVPVRVHACTDVLV